MDLRKVGSMEDFLFAPPYIKIARDPLFHTLFFKFSHFLKFYSVKVHVLRYFYDLEDLLKISYEFVYS